MLTLSVRSSGTSVGLHSAVRAGPTFVLRQSTQIAVNLQLRGVVGLLRLLAHGVEDTKTSVNEQTINVPRFGNTHTSSAPGKAERESRLSNFQSAFGPSRS